MSRGLNIASRFAAPRGSGLNFSKNFISGGPSGGMAGEHGMQGSFGGQGVSLMLRNKYGYATSGSTKLDGDVWDNKSPSRSVMIVLDGFWPDEIESFKISNTDLSMNGTEYDNTELILNHIIKQWRLTD